MSAWLIILLGLFAIALVAGAVVGGLYYLKKHSSGGGCDSSFPPPPGQNVEIKDNSRLWGEPVAGGNSGEDAQTVEQCYSFCKCNNPTSSGFAFWKSGEKCWCVAPPYGGDGNPKWTSDHQWYSGTFA